MIYKLTKFLLELFKNQVLEKQMFVIIKVKTKGGLSKFEYYSPTF